ncbi:hypothetical protein JOB18_036508 [Solea senegalensis]|uniref:Uncharacterized protein n=1 Tax=Solea senegalensis TaxID=28829 RepID=A0AAV6RF25_SOLSE|nr:hypothetical protein JOB18_036508 [Solea senegalensis]
MEDRHAHDVRPAARAVVRAERLNIDNYNVSVHTQSDSAAAAPVPRMLAGFDWLLLRLPQTQGPSLHRPGNWPESEPKWPPKRRGREVSAVTGAKMALDGGPI